MERQMNEGQRWTGMSIQTDRFWEIIVKMEGDKRCRVGKHVLGYYLSNMTMNNSNVIFIIIQQLKTVPCVFVSHLVKFSVG